MKQSKITLLTLIAIAVDFALHADAPHATAHAMPTMPPMPQLAAQPDAV